MTNNNKTQQGGTNEHHGLETYLNNNINNEAPTNTNIRAQQRGTNKHQYNTTRGCQQIPIEHQQSLMKRCRQEPIEHIKRALTNTNIVKQECINEHQQNTIWGDKEHQKNVANRCQ